MPSPTTSVALYRIVAAGALWIAPEPLGKAFGMATPPDQPGTFLGRVFASRDVALGVGVAQSSGAAQRHWLKVGIGTDAVDLVAAVLAGRSGALSRWGTVACFGASALALGLGIAALGENPGQ
jgi:hypothetical protein